MAVVKQVSMPALRQKRPFGVSKSNFRFPPERSLNSEIGACPKSARLGSQEERRAKSSEAPICADGHHKLSARSAVFCRIFASNLVDLVLGELLPRHAGRIAGFPEKAV